MQQVFDFLLQLKDNNNKTWFQEHKSSYEQAKAMAGGFFQEAHDSVAALDEIEPLKQYRIYNDVRFAKNKPLYKTHFGAIFSRVQPYNRGSFYLHLEPGGSFVGGGFWAPNAEDLLAIRKAISYEDTLVQIEQTADFKKLYGAVQGEGVKVAPKGFDKEHERIAHLRKKQFLLQHPLTDEEIISGMALKKIPQLYTAALPFFRYMTDVLITDGNGELKIK